MMKILLAILPPVAPDYPPLGAAALAGALTAAGYESRILDVNIRHYRRNPDEQWRWSDIGWYSWNSPENYREWLEEIARTVAEAADPREIAAVALSASSAARPFAIATIEHLRQLYPALPILVGGAGFFHAADVASFPASEGVQLCQGEGDEALVHWVSQLGSKSMKTPVVRARLKTLETLAVPDFSGFAPEQYLRPGVFPAETSRGCVNHCAFCDDTQMWEGFRMKSPQKVAVEFSRLTAVARHVSFCDSLLNPSPGRILAVAEAITPYKLTWEGMLQCRGIDAVVARAMRASGCSDVFLGVESFCPDLLKKLNKASTAEQAEQAILALHEAGIRVSMGLIVAGPPFQDRTDFELDLEHLERLAGSLTSVAVNPLCIPQDTPLREKAEKLGIHFPAKASWQFWHDETAGPECRFSWTSEAVKRLSALGLYRAPSAIEAIRRLNRLMAEAEHAR